MEKMDDLVSDFLSQKNFAVFGSFRNEQKYAYRIFKQLTKKGYKVFPVNPGLTEFEGVKCYRHVRDISEEVNVANIVTPPKVTLNIVGECKQQGINRIWVQPGAESIEVIDFCKRNGMEIIYGLCVMLKST